MSAHAPAPADVPDSDASIEPLLEHYRVLPDVHDELMDARGQPRAHWLPLLRSLAALGPAEFPRRMAAAERYLREAGVFHRVYGATNDGAERPWPLAQVPLLIASAEWASLSAGLVQRADLLEKLLADVYGPQTLATSGVLPASVIAGNPEFQRPMVGADVRGGHHLWFYAADLGRGPDGRWWVLGDRAQAPSGAGYALESRVAMQRALADVMRNLNVHRLAGFFQSLRAALSQHKSSESARVGLLSPGPLNETYFEHAYLARYLGFLLLEGEDLTVRRDKVYLRTVSGLKPIDVLWRRLDAAYADPIEFNAQSRLGVPGLARAVRAGNVLVANALGSGFLEARALQGFLPAIARALIGEKLTLPSVATWWCGQSAEREEVLGRLDELAIAPAFTGDLPVSIGENTVLPASLDAAARERLVQAIRVRGLDYVGQEVVRLSTTPVWVDGRLEPRPCVLRVYLARSTEGWVVMPGGFCRISAHEDARAVTMQRGSLSADVWVLSDQPPETTTLLDDRETQQIRRLPGTLPSRAADNLFWMGRYIDRVKGVLRLLRAYVSRAAESASAHDPNLLLIERDLVRFGVVDADSVRFGALSLVASALTQKQSPASLAQVMASARICASLVRDRLSPDAWLALGALDEQLGQDMLAQATEGEVIEMIGRALRTVAAFTGLVQDNINRLFGWRFLELGRRIERAMTVIRFVRRFADPEAPVGALDVLLELTDSASTYRQRYSISAARLSVVDLVVLDPNNPRSVAFQTETLGAVVRTLPGRRETGEPTEVESVAFQLEALLRTTRATEVDDVFLEKLADRLAALSDALTRQYFSDRDVPDSDWD